jgi:L-fucose isomerase-like protein
LEKIKVCAVSTVQTSFWGSSQNEFFKIHIPKLKELEDSLGFNLFWIDRPVSDQTDATRATAEARDKGADFLLIQSTTFASGGTIIPFAQSGIPLGIWGIPEISDTGAIPYNSFCGINMYASIIRQYLGKNIPYKWFFGQVDAGLFLERFSVTVKAIRAAKKIRHSRIALVGGVAPGFYDLAFDENKLMKNIGIQIFPHEFGEVKDFALSYQEDTVREQLKKFKSGCVSTAKDLAPEGLLNMARVYLALKEISEKNSYDSVAVSCWPKYRKEFGIVVCAVIGRLLEDGILASCEGDVEGLITMMMLKELSNVMPMLMDMSRFDERDGSILVWHCGSAPNCYADTQGVSLEGHYKPGSRVTGADDTRVAGVHDMYFKNQGATLGRISGSGESYFVFSGDFIKKEDRGFSGSRGWIANLEAAGKPLAVRDLIETIMSRGLQHHYAISAGRVEDEFRELATWLNIGELPVVPYSSWLKKV